MEVKTPATRRADPSGTRKGATSGGNHGPSRPLKLNSASPRPKNYCFGCGAANPHSMRLKFSLFPEEPVVRGTLRIARRYQGPPSSVHGGIIALIVDEAMGKLSRVDNVVAVTGELTVEYLKPVPLGRKIMVEARPEKQLGRNYWRECTIRDSEGTLLVRSRGRFVKIADRENGTPKG